jgi:hypothetical protein
MKFLTITTVKDIYYMLPQAEKTKFNAESVEYLVKQKKKKGDKQRFYSTAGGTLYSIGEYESIEEYSESLRQSPRIAAGYMNVECIPVIEMDEKAIISYEERMKAAKK